MSDIRTLPQEITLHRSRGNATAVLALGQRDVRILLHMVDTRGRNHVIQLTPDEAALLADDLGRIAHASPRQREVWRLELQYANSPAQQT